MAWYVYCVTEKLAFPELLRHRKPVPLQAVTGIEGNQVFLYPASELAVLVSQHNPSEKPSSQTAKEHARVIAACFESATVLPFRFGTVFPNDETLRRSMRSNQRRFLSNLEELRGKSEMHMRLTLEDCCREQIRDIFAGAGSPSYLSGLRESATRSRERQTLARAISTQIHRMFTPVAEEISCRLEAGKMQLDVNHLIPSRQVERYKNKFTRACEMMQHCSLHMSGPWPPYHFVHSLARPGTAGQPRAIPA